MLTIYKASAGSGKTYTLAYQYIKMLLGVKLESGRYVLNHSKYLSRRNVDPRPHSHILAVTFTNKATAEMKSRIIKELDAIGQLPPEGCKDAPYAADLVKEFCCTREELADVASKSLQRLLYDYGAFNISTIDSFFQVILRTFAREIDRQGDFRIELENDFAISSAVAMLLDTANYDSQSLSPAVSDWLKRMSDEQMREGSDFNPFNRGSRMHETLTKKLRKIFDEEYEKYADRVSEYLKDPTLLQGFEQTLCELSTELLNREVSLARELLDTLHSAGLAEENLNKSILTLVRNSINNPGLGKEDLKKYCDKKRPQYIAALIDHNPDGFYTKKTEAPAEVSKAVCRWFNAAEQSMIKRGIYATLIKETNTLRALSYIGEYINRFRTENNLILIGDTNSLIGAIINESDTPFIYERVGVELRNFLIDEFQDTSQLQWENLRPLLSNSLASDHDSLIIGDVKQSIYRFRGADSSLLAHRVAEVDFPEIHSIRGAAEGENTNYRSSHGIVKFNNTLFRNLAINSATEGYEGVAQSLPDKTKNLTSHILITNFTQQKGEEARNAALRLTGSTIMEQHARGYRWRDIAILCRGNVPAGEVIDYLMREFPEIKIMSEEALLLRNSSAVRMIVSMLEIIDKSYAGEETETEAESASAELTSGQLRRRRDMMIDRFEYFMEHGDDIETALNKALNTSDDAPQQEHTIADDLLTIRRLSPANLSALVDAIIDLKIPMEKRCAEMAYITAFADVVLEFSENYTPSVHRFLDYWRTHNHKFSISPSADQDAVAVMTVHKAKGLEWDCVHVPLMSWNLQPTDEDGWFTLENLTEVPAEQRPPLMYLKPTAEFSLKGSPLIEALEIQHKKATADNLNVAYVAFTRAVRELHINLINKSNSSGNGMPQAILEALPLAAPDSPIYMPAGAFIDELGNFNYGEPTYPSLHEQKTDEPKDTRPERKTVPMPTECGDYCVAFTSVNKVVTQVDDLLSQSVSDPDIGNDRTPSKIDENTLGAARRGIILHSILEQMTTADDLEKALRFCTAKLSDDEIDEYRQILLEAFESAGEYTDL